MTKKSAPSIATALGASASAGESGAAAAAGRRDAACVGQDPADMARNDPVATQAGDVPVGGLGAIPDFYRAEDYRAEESVGYLMRRIFAAIGQAVSGNANEPGAPTYPQWIPLHKLHMGTARTVAELARECLLDTGAMTRLLDRLEAKGLCRRVRSVADRRVVNIELTEDGLAAAKQVPHILSRVQNEHLAGFTHEEWEQLKSMLRRILDNAQALAARNDKNDSASS